VLVLLVAYVAVGIWLDTNTGVVFAKETIAQPSTPSEGFTGSISCRQCHERFYKLWSVSNHGLAMQPYTQQFSEQNLQPQKEVISIKESRYKAKIGSGQGWVVESDEHGEKKYPIAHVMGGKNVYYFLTPLDRGRLQTLPIAYDVNKKHWFDTAASGVRHFPGSEADEPVHWMDPLYTFNTSCYNCHVSQLSTNYDLDTDSYNTKWAEPGINCETCHGPSQEHIKVCQAAGQGQKPRDLKIISTTPFTAEQTNSMCNSCHAKMSPASSSFKPGESYYDHFDLVTLESPDYYPDGRDLGENYTMTSWRMSPCVKSGKLDCMHCHTSSGRYRFAESVKANNACLPCHKERVENITEHTHHPAGGEGNKCIACHMPMTQFAHMNRTDHSMRPPAPAVTIAFKSPNACNLCHKDKDARWSDKYVRQWHKDDYQKPALDIAHLVDAARHQDWKHLDDMLAYIERENRDEVTAASLIRLLRACNSDKKWPVFIKTLQADPSPLVRAASAQALDAYLTGASLKTLLEATQDKYRLVRIRAAASLAGIRPDRLKDDTHREALIKATDEYKAAMNAQPDDYTSHYNIGNFYMDRGEYQQAISAFTTSHRLRPDSVLPLNNIAFAYNAIGQNDKAEASFRKALKREPDNVIANLNLGMILGEQGRISEAEKAFRFAYKNDPNSAVAAYNLGIILASNQPKESLSWCLKAYKLRPEEGKYGYTYSFYLYQSGDTDKAIKVLQDMVNRQVPYADAYGLLGAIYLRSGNSDKALDVYKAARDNENLSELERNGFGEMLRRIQ
jgi:tetratricopeptide (TPR) repeat protein